MVSLAPRCPAVSSDLELVSAVIARAGLPLALALSGKVPCLFSKRLHLRLNEFALQPHDLLHAAGMYELLREIECRFDIALGIAHGPRAGGFLPGPYRLALPFH